MPVKIEKCVRCGKLFAARVGHTCLDCLEREEKELVLVRRFLAQNDKARAPDVCEATGVPVPVIMKFLRLGRLDEEALPPELLEAWIQQLDAVQKLEAQVTRHSPPPKRDEPPHDSSVVVGRRRS